VIWCLTRRRTRSGSIHSQLNYLTKQTDVNVAASAPAAAEESGSFLDKKEKAMAP